MHRVSVFAVSRQLFDMQLKNDEIPANDTFADHIGYELGFRLGELTEMGEEIVSISQAFDPAGDCYCTILYKESKADSRMRRKITGPDNS